MPQETKTFLHTHKLIFLGFIIFSVYFWSRFLRPRTSKILPLNLSILGFLTLTYVCLIFLYIIISILFPRKSNDIIEIIMDWLFTPLEEFDKYLKTITLFKYYFERGLSYILPKLEFLIIKTNFLYVILWIFPRIILLSALFIDIFIFCQLHYKYYVVLFGLLLFFNRYLKYTLKNYKNQLIQYNKVYIDTIGTPYVKGIHPAELAPDYDPTDPDEEEWSPYMALPFETFIEFQTQSIVYQNVTRKIETIYTGMKLKKKLWKEVYGFDYPDWSYFKIYGNFPKYINVSEKCEELARKAVEEILQVSLILEYYNKYNSQDKKFRNIKILIYLNYLLCWLYVLVVSLHTLDIEELNIVLARTWLLLPDPFTDMFISQIYE